MMFRRTIYFSILFLLIICVAKNTDAYDDEVTHPKITEQAINYSQIEQYIKNNLGFTGGLKTKFPSNSEKNIIYWLRKGSTAEDSPMCRASNHFHNPLLPWDQSYMSDDTTILGSLIRTYCNLTGWPYSDRKSSVTWGTGYLSPSPDGSKITMSNQEWSWNNARSYYYLALTSASNNDRETYFAKTFQVLGQVLHLIEDGAQPAHVRNDFISHTYFLKISSINFTKWFGSRFEEYVKTNPGLVTSAQPVSPTFTNPRLTDFWDTDQYTYQYDGSFPLTSKSLGITEFTNANYFSDFTIPNNNPDPLHVFPYPMVNNVNTQICEDYAPGSTEIRKYISRKSNSDCPPITEARTADHFASVSILNVESMITDENIHRLRLELDDNVHNTYAKELLPRAVGYSAGLINYFFRGQIGVKIAQGGITVTNINTETMESYIDTATGQTIGNISIYYDDTNSIRRLLTSYDLSAPLAPGQEVFIPFTEPNNNIRPGKYIVVFRGKLGNEEDSVIGKVTSPSINIYYASKRNDIYKIYKMDTDGNNQTIVYDNTNLSIQIGKLVPSPDGKTLAFTVSGPQIYLLGLTDGSLRKLADGEWPSWSPDGKKIAFQRETGQYLPSYGDVELFIQDIETGIETQLTNISGSSYSGQPAWSPDGNSIAYMKFDPYDTECLSSTYYIIYRIDPSGNAIGPVTCHKAGEPYLDSAPAWSPDGQSIGFTRRRYGELYKEALYKVDMATQTATKLTDSTGEVYSEFTPSWSLDGKAIVSGSNRDGDFDIWLIDPNGGGYITNLTNSNPDMDGYPVFGWVE